MGMEINKGRGGTCRSRLTMCPTTCSGISSSGDLEPPRHASDIEQEGRALRTAGRIQRANVIVDQLLGSFNQCLQAE
jgi:hypothetical protein